MLGLLSVGLALLLPCVLCKGYLNYETGLIRTSVGYMKGKLEYTSTGQAVQTYRGIPYAVPPIGRLRFKHPIPFGRWNGVLDATRYGKSCMQLPYTIFRLPGLDRFIPKTPNSEDCLTLNVFVPHPRPRDAPVMVFIHGGGFSIGGTSVVFFDGTELAGEENVIVVTLNYRLASLGFLYIDHPEIDPNCGLMDQLLAFKWVNSHIASFGGNPQQVTLFGHSAGGISIGIHMLSPLTKGLFKRAILQSGNTFMDYFLVDKNENAKLAVQTGRNLNCTNVENKDSLVRCLMQTEPNKLVKNEPSKRFLPFRFTSYVDGNYIVEDPVNYNLERNPATTDIEIMAGVVRNEGSVFLSTVIPFVFPPFLDEAGPYHQEFVAIIKFFIPNQSEQLYKRIENLFTDWKNFNKTEATLRSCEEFVGEYWFKCPMNKFLEQYSSVGAKIHYYDFQYRSPSTDYAKWIGIPHTEELRYLMGEVTNSKTYSKTEKQFSYRLMRYWANFARTGDPNQSPVDARRQFSTWITWPQYTTRRKEVLVLGPLNDTVYDRTESERCAFFKTKFHQLPKNN